LSGLFLWQQTTRNTELNEASLWLPYDQMEVSVPDSVEISFDWYLGFSKLSWRPVASRSSFNAAQTSENFHFICDWIWKQWSSGSSLLFYVGWGLSWRHLSSRKDISEGTSYVWF
jgi:hypothetical protein